MKSRSPAVTAILAGTMFLAGAGNSPASAQSDSWSPASLGEMAFAVPRVSPPEPEAEVELPQPLAPGQAALIRHIYHLQAHGEITAATRETEQLDTGMALGQAMLGHILADRYLSQFTKPGPEELRRWLARWPNLAEAADLRDLLAQRLRSGGRRAKASDDLPPLVGESLATPKAAANVDDADDSQPGLSRNADLDQSVWEAAKRHGGGGALRLLARTRGLAPPYRSQLLGEAARVLFTMGRDAEAYDLASGGAKTCARAPDDCRTTSVAGYVAGLSAWRMGRFDLARPMFEAAWRARLTTPGQRAGAALWAARSALRTGDFPAYGTWLARAAAEDGTFYGVLAQRMAQLSQAAGQGDGEGMLSLSDVDAMAATPSGAAGFALLQVGQRVRAEAEFRRLWPEMRAAPSLKRAVMLVADRAQLYELAAQLDDMLRSERAEGEPRRGAWFRIPNLKPEGGFRVDPALVFGVARTESNFNNSSVSSAGASGIMQLMPETASFVIDGSADGGHGAAVSDSRLREMLADPARNLALGQRYIVYLAGQSLVNGSLIHLLASYNCGPGRMAQWIGGLRHQNDPLLFIEAIPIDETRNFVSRVLTYTWLYANRLRLPTPSLDELAVGAWPRYHALPAHYDLSERLH